MFGKPREVSTDAAQATRSAVLTGTLLVTSLVIALVAQLDLGPASSRLAGYQVLWPQKWWFFTGLDKATLVAYQVDPAVDDLKPRDGRHGRAERLLGLNRIDDVRQVEVLPLGRLVPSRYWQTCKHEQLTACADELDRSLSYRMRNPARRPAICGSTALVTERTAIPAPHVLPDRLNRVIQIALTEVECSR